MYEAEGLDLCCQTSRPNRICHQGLGFFAVIFSNGWESKMADFNEEMGNKGVADKNHIIPRFIERKMKGHHARCGFLGREVFASEFKESFKKHT